MIWAVLVIAGLVAGLAGGISLATKRAINQQLLKLGLYPPGGVTDSDIIQFMSRLFRTQGYRLYRPANKWDSFDFILQDSLGQQRGVSTRHWRIRIDEPLVTALMAEARHLGDADPLIISLKGFTTAARQAAEGSGTNLWSVAELNGAVQRLKESNQTQAILTLTKQVESAREMGRESAMASGGSKGFQGDLEIPDHTMAFHSHSRPEPAPESEQSWLHSPRCPRCGKRMMLRKGPNREHWRCLTYPRCLGHLSKEYDPHRRKI